MSPARWVVNIDKARKWYEGCVTSVADGIRLIDMRRAYQLRQIYREFPRRKTRPARYHPRLALYDFYCGKLRHGNYTARFIEGTTPEILLQGWRDRRAELQAELPARKRRKKLGLVNRAED
jgi:hypothetical protein